MLRYLRTFLNDVQHRLVIFSHFLSVVFYCSPVWAGCLSTQDNRRLNSLIYKFIRLNCRDFSRILSNREICNRTLIGSFNLARIVFDALMLHSLCTNPTYTLLTIRLMQHSVRFSRFPNKMVFQETYREKFLRKLCQIHLQIDALRMGDDQPKVIQKPNPVYCNCLHAMRLKVPTTTSTRN